MRVFSYESVLDDYEILKSGLRELGDEHFHFLTKDEIELLRSEIMEELRTDSAFKLMTLLEAHLRADYQSTLARRKRDPVSQAYRKLCDDFRRETRQVRKPAKDACSRMSLDRILDALRDAFLGVDDEFRRVCSTAKAYFTFRNWYAQGRVFPRPQVPDPEDVYDAYREVAVRVLNRQ